MPYKDPEKERERSKRRYKTLQYRLYKKAYSQRLYVKEYRRKYQKEYYINNKKKKQKYYNEIGKFKNKIWQKCIECKDNILGLKKKKYCDACRKRRNSEKSKGNKYWKLVKNRQKGSNHPCWKDGITFWKKRIYDCPKYKQWRKSVFERDNYTCQECGSKSQKGKTIFLEAHHLISFTELLRKYKIDSREKAEKYKELWNIKLGQTLCKKCHIKTYNYGKWSKRKIK